MIVGFFAQVSEPLRDYLGYVPKKLIYDPLRTLYFYGPSMWGFGGWAGLAPEDICSQMTTVPALTWRLYRMEDCMSLLETRFYTVTVTFWTLAYILLAYKILSILWFRFFVLGPIVYEIRNLLKE
jgi:hypothetical protein